MKKLVLLMCVLLGASAIALAAACPMTSYNNYLVSGFSCTIDDKTFANFTYESVSSGGAVTIPASSVEVTPLTTPLNPGLRFGTGWGVTSNQTQDTSFDYTVTVNPGGGAITDLTLSMLGSAFVGTGSASIVETACLGDTLADGCLNGTIANLSTFNDANLVKLVDHITFPGVDVVDVFKDVEVFGGPNGSAVISAAENRFSETAVPEPGTLSMFGLSLISVAGLVRRKLNF